MNDSNRLLERVLEEMLSERRRASSWVHEQSELETTGEVLLGELVSGDIRAVEWCLDWVRSFDGVIPAKPLPGSTARTWTLQIDEPALCGLEHRDAEAVRAMHHLLFGGPAPEKDSATWSDLSALGLPPGLREDIERS